MRQWIEIQSHVPNDKSSYAGKPTKPERNKEMSRVCRNFIHQKVSLSTLQ